MITITFNYAELTVYIVGCAIGLVLGVALGDYVYHKWLE